MEGEVIVEKLKEEFRGRISHIEVLREKEGNYVDFPDEVHPRLKEALRRKGIQKLYSHQDVAYRLIKECKNVVLVTPTASGKTLAYNLPILDTILKDEEARAIYLFPTKALSQDQVNELTELLKLLGEDTLSYTYDGDTPRDWRKEIRRRARIVVTNPDMLHKGILPHHTRWVSLFRNLRFVVIDEIHVYRGIFGSHVANLMRRLKRIAKHYGSDPLFIATSATIANPGELAEKLVESPFQVIKESGAPRGRKYFIFWNPPVVESTLGLRKSPLEEAEILGKKLVQEKLQGIIFTRSRIQVEVLSKKLKDHFEVRPDKVGRIRGYRGGYLPKERRETETALRRGEVDLVVSTNALELGVDIGSLDFAILAGYPGTIASTWQQIGRAGRRERESFGFFVASGNPLDQYLVEHPEFFLSQSPEKALINPENLLILLAHIKCAAFELPFKDREKFGNAEILDFLEYLEEKGVLYHSGGKWMWTAEHYPADEFGLRTIPEENFVVVDQTEGKPQVIGEVDFPSAPVLLFPKAIYYHQGEPYQVERLDYAERKAFVRRVKVDYYTDAIEYTKVRVLDSFGEDPEPSPSFWGEVLVTEKVVGFKKIRIEDFQNVGFGKVDLPEEEVHTTAFWIEIPKGFLLRLPYSPSKIQAGLWGIAYLLGNLSPLFIMADRKDLGIHVGDKEGKEITPQAALRELGIHHERSEEAFLSYQPTIFTYEKYPGGVGYSEELFNRRKTLLEEALKVVETCPCKEGCPACVGPTKFTGSGGKETALAILRGLLK